MKSQFSSRQQLWLALTAAGVAAVGLFGWGVMRNQNFDFWYLPYNLVLALIPLLLAIWLVRLLQKRTWKNWLPLLITVVWTLFLPNSFYIVSDFIHLNESPRMDMVQDVVMLAQFSFVGLAFGFTSLYKVHREFIRRVSHKWASILAGLILLACSFAIYLGRDLRWNSWDIIARPIGLLSDAFAYANPIAHPQAFIMTVSFFIMLSSMYAVLWFTAKLISLKQ